jgi:hypothetical protein
LNSHQPGECLRKTREGNPTCVNCKGDHAANSKICIKYKQYREKIDNLKSKRNVPERSPILFKSTPAPWSKNNYEEHFPNSLNIQSKSNVNPVDRLSISNQINEFKRFSNLQNEFNAIPEIGKTLDLFQELVVKLEKKSDHGARLRILLEYQLF